MGLISAKKANDLSFSKESKKRRLEIIEEAILNAVERGDCCCTVHFESELSEELEDKLNEKGYGIDEEHKNGIVYVEIDWSV